MEGFERGRETGHTQPAQPRGQRLLLLLLLLVCGHWVDGWVGWWATASAEREQPTNHHRME